MKTNEAAASVASNVATAMLMQLVLTERCRPCWTSSHCSSNRLSTGCTVSEDLG